MKALPSCARTAASMRSCAGEEVLVADECCVGQDEDEAWYGTKYVHASSSTASRHTQCNASGPRTQLYASSRKHYTRANQLLGREVRRHHHVVLREEVVRQRRGVLREALHLMN